MEILPNEVYTTEEAQKILKISPSTFMRLIKKGNIRTAKIGKQYRIMGKELLYLLSPVLEDTINETLLHKDNDAMSEVNILPDNARGEK